MRCTELASPNPMDGGVQHADRVFLDPYLFKHVADYTGPGDYIFTGLVNKISNSLYLCDDKYTSVENCDSEFRLEVALGSGCPVESLYDSMAARGDLKLIRSLMKREIPVDFDRCMNAAISSNQVDMICFFGEVLNCVKDNPEWCSNVSRRGETLTLQKMKSSGFSRDLGATVASSEGGHLDTLKYLVRNGCPWDTRIVSRSAVFGHDHVVYWASSFVNPSDRY